MAHATSQRSPIAILNQLEKPLLFVGLLLMILIINYQTLFRYSMSTLTTWASHPDQYPWITLLGDPSAVKAWLRSKIGWATWSEELARYIFVWISYLAVSLSILSKNSIRMDAVHNALPPRLQNIVWVAIYALSLLLTAAFLQMGIEHIGMQREFTQTTPALQINYLVPYLILPLGFGLMSLRTLQCLYESWKNLSWYDFVAGLLIPVVLLSPLFIWEYVDATLLLFCYFVVFIVLGVPIAFSLGLASIVTIIGADTLPLDYIAQIAFVSIDSFPIMAIPFFIAAGIFMGAGGLSERLLIVADKLVGSLPGGLALASIMTCMFFSAISGSGPATVAAIGTITIPAMAARGYNIYFAAAVVACAGAIGVIIPPSNPFVVYGVAAQASIGKLFIAGIVPGLFMGFMLMAITYFISKKNGWKGEEGDRSFGSILISLWQAKWALLVPVIILGGIYGGIMTPTESAAVAALYGLIIGKCVYRELSWKKLWNASIEATQTSSIIIILMAMATIFGNIMTLEQIPETVASGVLTFTDNKYLILFLICILLLIIGVFMEALAAIVIITPVLLPLVLKLGVDPIHFGVIMVVGLAIGFITPPVGVNLFVASGIAKIGIDKIAKASFPLLLVMILVLLLVTYVPAISLVLL
ncbi:TRAP transporter large permease subunit [Paenalcaligenes sp. Me131]|uniref:TRAP transporter large permease n=1 Tax=Paenalcaligenes sp. Me131 TaxID=3392636 RepID=UPI003D297342